MNDSFRAARWSVAILICLCVATVTRADDPVAAAPKPPTFGELLKNARPGEYLKFRQTQTQGLASQTLTMWQVYKSRTNAESIVIGVVITDLPKTDMRPPTTAGQNVRMADSAVRFDQPGISFQAPQGTTLTALTYSEKADVKVTIDGRTWTCRELKMVAEIEAQGRKATLTQTAYLSDLVPFTGMVKMVNEWTGAVQNSSTMELIGYPGIELMDLKRGSNEWFVAMAKIDGYKINMSTYDGGAPDNLQQTSWDVYQALLVRALAWSGMTEQALAMKRGINQEVYRNSARQYILAVAGYRNDRATVEQVKERAEDDPDALIRRWSWLLFSNKKQFVGSMKLEQIQTILAQVAAGATDELSVPSAWRYALEDLMLAGRPDDVIAGLDTITDPAMKAEVCGHLLRAAAEADGDHAALVAQLWERRGETPTVNAYIGYMTWLHAQEKDALTHTQGLLEALDRVPMDFQGIKVAVEVSEFLWTVRSPAARPVFLAVGKLKLDQAEKRIQERIDSKQNPSYFDYQEQMQAAAKCGNVALAKTAYDAYMAAKGPGYGVSQAIVDIYRAGETEAAMKWLAELTPYSPEQPFMHDALVAEVLYDIAQHEADVLGHADVAAGLRQRSVERMKTAENGMVAYNAKEENARKQTAWGGGIVTRTNNSLLFRMTRDAMAAGDWALAGEVVRAVGDHLPYSNYRDDLWRMYLIELAMSGDAAELERALADWPTAPGGGRAYTEELVIQAMAKGGHIERAAALARQTEGLFARALHLSFVIIERANMDDIDGALSLLPELTTLQTEESINYPRHLQAAHIAIARAQARAGQIEAARATMLGVSHDTAVGLKSDKEFNGREGSAYVLEIAWYAALNGCTPEALADWAESLPQANLRAYFAIGALMGQTGLAVDPAFHKYSVRNSLYGF